MVFYCFTTPGLEDVTVQEIADSLNGARILKRERATVHFEYDGDPSRLLSLGTTEDVYALVASGQVARERPGLRAAAEMVRRSSSLQEAARVGRSLKRRKPTRVTYRVVAQRPADRHQYRRVDLQTALSEAIGAVFPRWKEVPDDAHLEVWVRQIDREILCGVRLSDRTMRHRAYKVEHLEASLRPIVARCMVILSDPQPDDVFLDPMCGAGTLLIERGEHSRYAQLLGGDIREEAVAATLRNIGPKYQPIAVRQWDATRLPLEEGSVSRIACNLPFGKKVGSHEENIALYRDFLREAVRVLKRPSQMTLLTSETQRLRETLSRHSELTIRKLWHLTVLGQEATLFQVDVLG